MMRPIAACINCGESREIAAHGLCFTCYRQKSREQERSEERAFGIPDRHNPAIRKEHKKLFRGFTSIMVGLADLGAGREVVLTIRKMLEPFLEPILPWLTTPSDAAVNRVNREQESKAVHSSQTGEAAQVAQPQKRKVESIRRAKPKAAREAR